MKSIGIRDFAQVKMRGKKTMRLRCGCCVVQDFRYRERIKQLKKEIKQNEID